MPRTLSRARTARADSRSARSATARSRPNSDGSWPVVTSRGVVMRAVAAYHLPNALRMTIGTEEANPLVADGLSDFMAQT